MKRLFVLVALLLTVVVAPAQTPDDQYVYIYNLMQEADAAARDEPALALTRYREAYAALQSFAKGYPDWNEKVVQFRLSYLANRVSTLAAQTPATAQKPAQPATPQAPAAQPISPDLQNRISGLEDQIRELQADRSVLEAKLKEALTLQPAASDPRELEKAEQRIRDLEKEKDLLKVGLEQARSQGPAADPKVVEKIRQELASANLKLAAEAQRAAALETEKKELQTKLQSLIPSNWNADNIEKTRTALKEANQEAAQHKQAAEKIKEERDALQARIMTLTSEADAAKALRAENEVLKRQLADVKASGSKSKSSASSAELARVRALVATLESEKDILRLEKVALENRVKELLATAPVPAEASKRIQELEKERNDLQSELQIARSGDSAPRIKELEEQIATLRLRVEVLEARKIPYTAEELALFQKPEPKLAAAQPGPKPTRQLPPGTTQLAAEAQRHFVARDFEKAEDTYAKVLTQDQQNGLALANLAAIQIERGKFDEAEKNLRQALAADPDQPHALSTLGLLKFQQKQYDEALDALSRAAKAEPENAQIQNRLGLVLSEKGLRGPAETALRKAIQIEPGYGEAHHNLAVVYATQQPPLLELARWHYQKGLTGGQTRNPRLEQLLQPQEKASK